MSIASSSTIHKVKQYNLKLYYQNTRGLKTKTLEFYGQITSCDYDMVILTETWLNDSISSNELFDDRYVVYRRDRGDTSYSHKKDGGGVLIAINKKIKSKRVSHWESQLEDLWVIVDLPVSCDVHQIAFCAVYLPPPVNRSRLEYFIDGCNKVFDKSLRCCILGDFNLSNINWSFLGDTTNVYSVPSLCQPLVDFININGLHQHNTVVNDSNKVLDLVLSDLSSCNVNESHNSMSSIDRFHPPLDIDITLINDPKLPFNKNSSRRNFHRADYGNIFQQLRKYDWESIFNNISDVDGMVTIFYQKIRSIIEEFVPIVSNRKNQYPPWYDIKIIRALKEKLNTRRRFKKYKNPRDGLELELLSSRCSKMVKDCYNRYIRNLEDIITENPKYFWTYIKAKRGGTSTYPISMSNELITTSDGSQICELFSKHFESVYDVNELSDNYQIEENKEYFQTLENSSIYLPTPVIDSNSVFKKLTSINRHKGAGPDGIPPRFIAECAKYLVVPLLLIYNASLQSGVFPQEWKVAKVVPIHKTGNQELIKNYRPISVLSSFAKIFESLICPFLQNHFKQLLSTDQNGFVKNRSTTTNLINFSETIANALDCGKQVDAIYTDFSKAFDRVPHCILLQKLSSYGVSQNLVNWLKSYLVNRKFFVVVNGFTSSTYGIASGVPQGSHLGPILFNIFINDLPACLKSSDVFMYADDLKFCRIIESIEDSLKLQSDLDKVHNWCNLNRMELNTKKCYYVRFARKSKLVLHNYHINHNFVTEKQIIRDLGVLFDNKLTFKEHLEDVTNRASRMLGFVLRNVKGFRNPKTKILLYYSLVRSILEYCSVIWRPHYSTHILRLERIQKRFLWHLTYSSGLSTKILSSYQKRLSHFKICSLENRRRIIDVVFVSKVLTNKTDCPQLLNKLNFRVPTKYPRYTIIPFALPFRRTVLGTNSPVCRLGKLLNEFRGQIDVFSQSPKELQEILVKLL